MSDAGRKMDVEDVLSSIRRLVSEEARSVPEKRTPQSRPSAPASPAPVSVEPETAAEPVSTMPVREKLVLTPAFRIPGDPAVNEPVQDSPAKQEAPEPTIQAIHPVAEDSPVQPSPITPAETASTTAGEPAPESPFEANVAEFPPKGEDIQTAPLDLSSIIPSLQELQEQAQKQKQHLEPVPELTENTEPAADVEPENEPAEEVSLDPIETTPDIPAEPPLTAKTEPVPEDTVEAVSDPEPVAEHPAHSSEFDAIDYTAQTETYLDEEALRELVSEMVRSELQGELGDRITRNVRKLVRREIHRALASREFD